MDTIESIIRWLGEVAALVVIVVVLNSVRWFRMKPAEKIVGNNPVECQLKTG
jgi:hypothetical protein